MVTSVGSFLLLVPVKSPGNGKSRFTTLTRQERARLAAAFATDVVDACLDTPQVGAVAVVSDDADFAATLVARGATYCPDAGGGLNAALRHGARQGRDSWPGLQPVALLADLPALRSADLAAALSAAADSGGPCYVADADGTGTTLYTAGSDQFDPRFGVGSAAAHQNSGARSLAGLWPSLRHDVDDAEGLETAISLVVGSATRRVLAEMRSGRPPLGRTTRSR